MGVPVTLNIVPAVTPLGAPSRDGLALRPGAAPVAITVGSSSDQVLSIANPRLVFKPGDQKAPVTVQPVAPGRAMLGLAGSVYDFATAQSTLWVVVASKLPQFPTSFAGECPAHDSRLFRYDGQVRACGRVWLTAALLPLLQGAFADAVGS